MRCKVCKENIETCEFDCLEAFQETSPVTFRLAYFHAPCYELEIEEAKSMQSFSCFANRYDEYITKNLQKLCYL